MTKALFRLDSGGQYGLGHIMRCKALADALTQIEIECTFAAKSIHSDKAVEPHKLYFINSFSDKNEEEFLSLAKSYDIIIVDHYDYTAELFYQLSKPERSILVILDDEGNRGKLYADIIINPISHIELLNYDDAAPRAKVLSGAKYLLLRQEFQQCKDQAKIRRKSIVITFGGSDVSNLTLPLLKMIKNSSLTTLDIIVVTGSGCRFVSEIKEYCHQSGFNHQHNVADMAALFARAKLAISAAGSTAFELASCGVPSVFAVVADNQLLSIKGQVKNGWCMMVDCRKQNKAEELVSSAEEMIKAKSLQKMSQTARSIVDAKGAERVALKIKALLK